MRQRCQELQKPEFMVLQTETSLIYITYFNDLIVCLNSFGQALRDGQCLGIRHIFRIPEPEQLVQNVKTFDCTTWLIFGIILYISKLVDSTMWAKIAKYHDQIMITISFSPSLDTVSIGD
jgi:hypothetical protein